MRAINKIESGSFAAACYDSNSIDDLKMALVGSADANDCAAWDITAIEWREQIELAIVAMQEKSAD